MELLSTSLKKKAEEHQLWVEVCVTGEQLRQRLHNAKLIKDRCNHMRTYPNCFVASELVDWLLECKEAPDRETAVTIMQKFVDHNVIHHVCDEYLVFKDARLLYRFRDDDGTLAPDRQTKVFRRAQRLYETMMNQEDSILQIREHGAERYRRAFLGSQMLDWLVKNREVASRVDGEEFCRAMLEYGIIQHVAGRHHFSDSDLLYQFIINFRRKRRLMEVLEVQSIGPKKDSPDSPFCLRKLNAELPPGSFVCAPVTDPRPPTLIRRSGSTGGSAASYNYYSPNKPLLGPPSVLKRPVSVEELLAPGAPYISKVLNILGDDVGWGFVIRGSGPCYVQAVDPGGPAAAAGMKTRQFLRTVNGLCCLRIDYQTINKLIVAGPRRLILEVLEPFE
ncbi:DEP domain-containing mTOR-interacting protein-like [Spea bombifrons]|uniref:DEP domain-containing mTOR-interacting protein-like n=1 Tax=Spea bombifrons TaxID=233779 RepID=UPI00234B125E|nr:DEP domain-containing mTOR-interacting protein-like [Spea bombifrons]